MSDVDPRQFRQALGSFLSGVTVLTVRDGDAVHGMTASAFSSLSLDPPLVLACVAHKAHLHAHLAAGGRFAVSILREDQAWVSNHFAGYGKPDDVVQWDEAFGRTPVIAGALAWLDCAVHALQDGGDHTILIGRVERLAAHDGAPLAYWRGKYGAFTPA